MARNRLNPMPTKGAQRTIRKKKDRRKMPALLCAVAGYTQTRARIAVRCVSAKSAVVEVAGEMRGNRARGRKLRNIRRSTSGILRAVLGYALARGNNPGSAYYRYKAKFGGCRPWLKPEPKTPGLEVIQWVRSQNIAFAKSRLRRRRHDLR